MIAQDRFQPLRIALNHSGRDVEQAFVMSDDAEPVRTCDAPSVNQLVGVDSEKIGKHRPDFLGQFVESRRIGGQTRDIAVGNPPAGRFGVIFGADRP